MTSRPKFVQTPPTLAVTVPDTTPKTASVHPVASRVPPPGFSADIRAVYADGQGRNAARWPAPEPLFARDLANADCAPGAWAFNAEGVLRPTREPGAPSQGEIWTRATYSDFALNVEFRVQSGTDSGVILRSGDIVGWRDRSIEIQIFQGDTGAAQMSGSILDLVPPSRPLRITPGEWNHYTIVAQDSVITVTLNHEPVNKIDLSLWIQPGLNPDGTSNRFRQALRDMPRVGRIGLEDKGGPLIEFRNLFIEPVAGAASR